MAVSSEVAEKVARLRKTIEQHNRAYYLLDAPTVSRCRV
jgi:NAD-dependent DNA ligase